MRKDIAQIHFFHIILGKKFALFASYHPNFTLYLCVTQTFLSVLHVQTRMSVLRYYYAKITKSTIQLFSKYSTTIS